MALDKLVTRETLKTVVTEQEQTYAKQDGYYETLHAGSASVADNLTPYSSDSGEAQDIPFILQGTACGNGETQVDTGSFAQIKEKRGNSVVVNQLVDTTDTSVTLTNGHKYFTFIDGVYSAVNGTGQSVEVDGSTDKIVDLTLWFGTNGNIPAHLLSHPEDFIRYYQGSLAYNAGTLVNANGRYLECVGRNIYDPTKTYNSVTPDATYYYYGSASTTMTYYDKDKNAISTESVSASSTFTTPSACIFINSSNISNITISLYYDGESGYDEYYPYEVLSEVDTGNEVLLAYDVKYPSGLIERNTGELDLSTKTWTLTTQNRWMTSLSDAKNNSDNVTASIISDKYEARSPAQVYGRNVGITFQNYLYVYNRSTTTPPSGNIQYLLNTASRTTEQSAPFGENITIDDFGSMQWSNTDFNGIPQGCEIFYPVDYKAGVDTLYNHLDGDFTNVARTDDVEAALAEKQDAIIPTVPSEDGVYVLKATVVSGEITYQWIVEEEEL